MQGLDDIPWNTLHHAYGTAEDVPELLRQLQTADPDVRNEDSPLWQLFGNIWHQGTVYEATSYAVPFLISLAADPATPDRAGILGLLAAIAQGNSYLAVHEVFLRQQPVEKIGIPGTDEFERKKAQELAWVAAAHSAVAEGYEKIAELACDQSDVSYAAANVLASLRVRAAETNQLLLHLLERERRNLYRAGVLLLIGEHGHDSGEVRRVVRVSASADSITERRAAAMVAARLCHDFPSELHAAVVDAICDEDLESHFDGLPWDASEQIDQGALFRAESSAVEQAVDRLLASTESGAARQESYYTLCRLLFASDCDFDAAWLKTRQQRTLNAIVRAMDVQGLAFRTPFSCYGLPDSRRSLRRMAAGSDSNLQVDETLPVIGAPDNPARPLAIWGLKPGDRLHSRYFGLGRVVSVTGRHYDLEVVIDFDEEGRKTLGLIDSPFTYLFDTVRYLFRRLTGRT